MKNTSILNLFILVYALNNLASADTVYSNDLADSDGDGLPDFYELGLGLDPYNSADGEVDSDGDLLSFGEEYKHGSKDSSIDTDGDSLTDFQEIVLIETNPADRNDPVVIPSYVTSGEVETFVNGKLDLQLKNKLNLSSNTLNLSSGAANILIASRREKVLQDEPTLLSLSQSSNLPATGNFLNGALVEPNANGVIFGTDLADEIILNNPTLSETEGMSVNALGGDDVITVNAGLAGSIRGDVGVLVGGNDTITLASGATAHQIKGDNLSLDATAYGNDTLIVAGTVIDGIFGDTGQSTAVGGMDKIVIQNGATVQGVFKKSIDVLGNEVVGANALIGDGSSGTGGNDEIIVEFGATIIGDLKGDGTIGETNGGDDVITIGGLMGTTMFEGSERRGVVAGDAVRDSGGNDTITVTETGVVGFLKGDAADIDGGDDTIVISGRATLIQGDDTFQDGGNDTIIVTAEGIIEKRDPNSSVEGTVAGDASHRDGGDDIILIHGKVDVGVVGDGVRRNGGNDAITIFDGAFVGAQVAGDGTTAENDIPGEFGGDDVIRALKGSYIVGPISGDSGVTKAGGNDNIFTGGEVETSVIGDTIPFGRGGNDIIVIGQSAKVGGNIIGDKVSGGNGGTDIIDISGIVLGSIEGDNVEEGSGGPDTIFVRKRTDGANSVGGSIFGDLAPSGNGGNDRIVVQGIVNGNIFGDSVGLQSGEDMIQVSGTVNGQILADDLTSTSSRADDTLLDLAKNTFRIEFLQVNSIAELPTDRESFSILGSINGSIHLRMFDKGRNRLFSMDESSLVQGDALNRIKSRITVTPFPNAKDLTDDQKKDFVADVIQVSNLDLLLLRDTIDILPAGVVNGNIVSNNPNGGKDNIKIRGTVNAGVFAEGGDIVTILSSGRVTGQVNTSGGSSDTLRINGYVGGGVVVSGGDSVIVNSTAVIETQFNSSEGIGADVVEFNGTLNGEFLLGGGDFLTINSNLVTGNINSRVAGGDTIVLNGAVAGNLFAGANDIITINQLGAVDNINLNDNGSTTVTINGTVRDGILLGGGDNLTTSSTAMMTGNIDSKAAGADSISIASLINGSIFAGQGDTISVLETGEISGNVNLNDDEATQLSVSGTLNNGATLGGGDTITITNNAKVTGNINSQATGADSILLSSTLTGSIFAGAGDKVSVFATGLLTGNLNLSDSGKSTVIVEGKLNQGATLAGDVLDIKSSGKIMGNIDSRGSGADQVSISGKVTGNLFGSTGDTITVKQGGIVTGSINTRSGGGSATIVIQGTVNTTGIATSIVTKGGSLTVSSSGVVNGNIDTKDNGAVDTVTIRGTVNGSVIVGPEDTLIR
jgi:hypothetical protein